MNRLRENILPVIALLGAVALGLEGWEWQRLRVEVARGQAGLERSKQERDWLGRQDPAPTPENEAALVAELAAVRGRISQLRNALAPRAPDPLAGPVPADSTEAFFELANLVERARARAQASRVILRPDERFGFAAYANEGPEAGRVGRVHRQRQAVQALLEPLFESQPLALLAVRRTGPVPQAAGEDYFALPPGLSLRQAGLVETVPVQVEFTGQTSTLRTLLTGIAALRTPVIVRSVAVEPLPAATGDRPRDPVDGPVPVVRQSLSKFAVTMEFVLLAGDTGDSVHE